MQGYNLQTDFDYQREFYLKVSLVVTLLLTVLVTIFASNFSQMRNIFPLPPIVLIVVVVISDLLHRQKLISAAIWVYLIGSTCAFTLLLWTFTVSTALCIFLLIPSVLSALLIERQQVKNLTILCLALMYISTAIQVGHLAAILIVFAPALLGILVVAVIYANTGNMLEMVYWATDIQQKDTHRAESFYLQKAQLADALRQLSYTHSQLEIVNKQLGEAQLKAENANKAKSLFLSNMSHELRTPLNVVIGYSTTMLERPIMYDDVVLPEPYRPDIQLIQDNGYHLLSLINDILDLSKIEAGKLTLNCQATPLPDLFASCLATAIGLVKDKPIQIRQDFSPDLPLVWADPMRIRQIVLNLMSNAVKFTHVGSITLRAQVEAARIRISVIDTGIGIPEGALKHIFDRFEQAERDTEKHYGGTGLGLDISKQLAFMHGSDLTVESKIGSGSVFSFTLPIQQTEQEAPPVLLTGDQSTAQVLDPSESTMLHSVMVVEDNVVQHNLMHRSLESMGYVVINVHDGNQVLEMAGVLVPDLIVLDILLPNVDGWKIYRDLRSNEETSMIPIIVCTAIRNDEFPSDVDIEHYLCKPFSPDALLAIVQDIIGMSYAPYDNQS
jgi:signal transduction histidine kinase/ActR/RegA family two-component response regulator